MQIFGEQRFGLSRDCLSSWLIDYSGPQGRRMNEHPRNHPDTDEPFLTT